METTIHFQRDGVSEFHDFGFDDTLEQVYSKTTRGEELEEEILILDGETLPRDLTQIQETEITLESVITITKKYSQSFIDEYITSQHMHI